MDDSEDRKLIIIPDEVIQLLSSHAGDNALNRITSVLQNSAQKAAYNFYFLSSPMKLSESDTGLFLSGSGYHLYHWMSVITANALILRDIRDFF